MEEGRNSSLSVNTATQPEVEQPLTRLSPWVRVVACICFFVIAATLSSTIGYFCRVDDFEMIDKNLNVTDVAGGAIHFSIDLVSVDAKAGVVTWDWYVADAGGLPNNTTLNIFFDTNLLWSTNDFNQSNNVPDTPIFRYNTSAAFDDHANNATFRISIALLGRTGAKRKRTPSLSSLQKYPFDVYYAEFFVFALDSVTGREYPVEIDATEGIAVGFQTSAVRLGGDGRELLAEIEVSRGVLVKAYAIIIVIAFWIVTLMFSFTTITSVFLGYGLNIALLVIPVSTLIAFAQLRGTMPGAPDGTGALIDYVGILPCFAITSLSTALTMGALVFSNPTEKRETIFHRMFPADGEKTTKPHRDPTIY